MNKSDLVNAIAEKNTLTKAVALRILDTTIEAIRDALAQNEEVVLPDVGKLIVETRAERKGRNPKTGEAIHIPAAQVVKFKVAKSLKDLVQKEIA